jgi:hypothetical protein
MTTGRIIWAVISAPFALVDLTLKLIFPGDSGWSLRRYEIELLQVVMGSLDDENQAILARQLNKLFFVERLHDGRVVRIHFKWKRGSIDRMKLPKEYNLAKLKLKTEGGKLGVSIGTYDGLIFSFHYTKPPKPFLSQGFEIVEAEYGGPANDTVTRAIDRLEHGKQR